VTFQLHYGQNDVLVESRLPARQLVSNALAAVTVGLVSGLSLIEVADALSTADVRLRLRTHKTVSGATIIDDTYNASPASMNAALDLLGEIAGHRIAVLGDMGELGTASDEGHRAVGRRAAEVADVIHAVGEHSRLIAEAARAAGHRDVHHWDDKNAVLPALEHLTDRDIVLFKASRAMAFESLVTAVTQSDG
jgi:UDP-N-acetylmuramoyl-tripeptide--D-alanyl-D-alanine ligase